MSKWTVELQEQRKKSIAELQKQYGDSRIITEENFVKSYNEKHPDDKIYFTEL